MNALLLLLVGALSVISAQFLVHQPALSYAIQPPPPPVTFEQPVKRDYSHRAVVLNSQHEAQLPPQLLNPFYKNPRIVEVLAKESWFTPGEMLVTDREAEKIPRQKIYSVLKNAGLVRRR